DDFDDLVALPDWLRDAPPSSIAWALQAILALRDAAEQIGWRGDMRHLPSVAVPSSGSDHGPHLVVKQHDNGATFIISSDALRWADTQSSIEAIATPHCIAPITHPTTADIAEAMTITLL